MWLEFRRVLFRSETMIIGEPTNNEIIVGSKGLMEYKISFKGIKTHSSTPQKGKNAIMNAILFIKELNNFYENKIKNNLNNDFEIPYTTMNIGKIEGGSNINSVPDSCEFLVDFRTTDKAEEQQIVKKLEELKEKYQAKVEELNRISPFLNKTEISNKTCNFITEASFLKNNRIILGAGPITAHEVNEYVTIDSLYKLVEQYKELIKKYCNWYENCICKNGTEINYKDKFTATSDKKYTNTATREKLLQKQ